MALGPAEALDDVLKEGEPVAEREAGCVGEREALGEAELEAEADNFSG